MVAPRHGSPSSAEHLYEQLRAQGVELKVDGDRLRVTAPTGVLTDVLQDGIRRFKGELMVLASGDTARVSSGPALEPAARLTPAQERLWLFQQLNPAATTYNLTLVIRVDGQLDVHRLEEALTSVIRRHEPLRSVVGNSPDGGIIVTLDAPRESLPMSDFSSLATEEQSEALASLVQREQTRAFDLATERPLRALLTRRSENSHALVITLHHIAVDGMSLATVLRDLATFYGGSEPTRLRTTFHAYANWQRRYWTSERLSERATFWRERLRGAPLELELPVDHTPSPRAGQVGGMVLRELDAQILSAMSALAQSERASLFMLMLAAYAAVLHRQSGQRDVIIGTPLHGREQSELTDLVGMFVNQLPLRVNIPPGASLRDVLRVAREQALACMSPHEMPFGEIVEALGGARDTGRNPVFQVLLNVLPAIGEANGVSAGGVTFSLPGLKETFALFDGQAKFDMTLYVVPSRNDLQLALVYDADRFRAERMTTLLEDVASVLREGVTAPDVPLEQLSVFRQDAKFAASSPWARTDHGIDAASVPEYLARHVAATADNPAVIGPAGDQSYRELHQAAQRIARLIASANTGSGGHVVGVMVPHGESSVSALLGALLSGRAYVPLDPAYPEARLRLMIEDAGITTILTTSALRAHAAGMLGPQGAVIDLADPPDATVPLPPLPAPESTAYLLYTSGSTGRPKAVVQTHRNLLIQAHRYAAAVGLRPTDRLAWLASISFDASLMDIFGGLIAGASICPIDPKTLDLAQLPTRLVDARLTVLHVTPTVFRTIERSTTAPSFPTVRAVVLGGEAVRPEHIAFFDGHFGADAQLLNLYGASEHSFSLGFYVDRHSRSREVPIGMPLGDTEVVLLDESGRVDPVFGEMALRSAHSALGYWNAPDQTARAFIADLEHAGGRLYRTGDVVRRRRDGAIVFVRRADHQVKIRGHRIEVAEIETLLLSHPAVFEAAVHAVPDADGEASLAACVVFRPEAATIGPTELGTWLADRLPSYMLPTGWAIVERLPRTPSGKIDRRALPRPVPALHEPAAHDAAPDALEAAVIDIWRSVLAMPQVGLHDNFFALGGHSLSASRVVSRLREQFDVPMPLRQFFDHPTVAQVAAWVRTNRGGVPSVPPLLPRSDEERATLSYAQERMWILQRLDPRSTAYNMGSATIIDGPLDVDRLRRACTQVALRQETLRTRFELRAGRPVPVVDPAPTHQFDVHDVASEADDTREAHARRIAEDLIGGVYDLSAGPLCRIGVIRLASERHLLAVGMHHIISDMWSYGVFSREVRDAYDRDGIDVPPPTVTYRDVARWQRDWLQGATLQAQVDYWRARLQDAPPLTLPTDYPRPAYFTVDGADVRIPVSADLRQRIESLAAQQRATPFMVLLAGFNALLAAYARQHDISVGVPVAGRSASETHALIGAFVNTLVLRTDLSGDPTFLELIERIRKHTLDDFVHQDAPFEVLVKELNPPRDPSRTPLFQVLFNLANVRTETGRLQQAALSVVPLTRTTAQFDLGVNVGFNEFQTEIALTFNTSLFSRATAERLLTQYVALLEQATSAPTRRLADLQRATTVNETQQLHAWNDTARPINPDAGLLTRLVAQASEAPTRVAVESPTGAFTYAELVSYAQQVSAALRGMGVRPGDRVAIVMERSREMLGALLGILGAGATYVPVDPNYPEARVRFMLDDADVAGLVTHRQLEQRVASGSRPVLNLDTWVAPAPTPFQDVASDDIAYVIYTSGSTGTPKGVAVTHRGLSNFLAAMREQPGIGRDDVLFAVTTISFDIAVLELYLPLTVGARVVIAREDETADGRRLMRRLEEAQVTLMQATPATWKLLLAAGWAGRSNLRVLCGGEALASSLAHELLPRVAELWNMYGPTETTVWSTMDRVVADEAIHIGRPIANTTLYVLNEHRALLPVGVPGELYIGGHGLAAGYLNRDELTSERFVAHPFRPGERVYRTGDLVRYRHDGRLEHLGRLDHQVKIRGFRIELGEVEAALRAQSGVLDAVIAASNDRLIGYVVIDADAYVTGSELRSGVAEVLPAHMVPSFVVILDAMPLTPNGKVDRSRLPDPTSRTVPSSANALPTSPLAREIAAVWEQLLGVAPVYAGDNFFERGGHSLLAMEAVTLIENRTGARLEPRALFFRTLQELAESGLQPS